MSAPELRFIVYGDPMPKGSKTAMVIGGKARLIEGAGGGKTPEQRKRRSELRKKRADWFDAIQHEAWRTSVDAGRARNPMDGALQVCGVFVFARPKSRKHDVWHTVKPDLDKLLRGVGDALVKAGAIREDCRIVSFDGSRKRYVLPGEEPRAEIMVAPFGQLEQMKRSGLV